MISLLPVLCLAAWPSTAHLAVRDDGALEVASFTGQRLVVSRLARDGWSCDPRALVTHEVGPQVVVTRECALTEQFTAVSGGVEHELVLAQRPAGRGALTVRLEVDAPWLGPERGGHRFGGPGLAGWHYGAASLVRAGGLVPLETRRVPGGLEVVVPERELDAPDAFPLHIDPLIAASPMPLDGDSIVSPSSGDESSPSVAFAAHGKHFLAVWSDTRRASNRFVAPETDLFAALIDPLDGGRWDFVKPDPSDQNHPVVAATDGGFVIAWEDGRITPDVKVGFLGLSADAGSLTFTPYFAVPGSAPSLSPYVGGREPVLAYVPRGTPRFVRVVSLDAGQLDLLGAGVDVLQTTVFRSPNALAVGAASSTEVRAWVNSVAVNLPGGNQIGLIGDPNDLYAVVGGRTAIAGVDVYRLDGGQSVLTLTGHQQPAWTLLGDKPTLGTVNQGGVEVRENLQNPYPLPGFGVDELAIAGSQSAIVATYTVGPPGGRDLVWSMVSGAGVSPSTTPVAVTRARLKRQARVAFNGDRGLVVWLAGGAVRGRWLTRRADLASIDLSLPFDVAADPGVVGAVDVTMLADGSAAVAFSTAVVGLSPQIVVQKLALDATVAPSIGRSQFAVTELATSLHIEAAASALYVVWKEGSTLMLLQHGSVNPPEVVDTVPNGYDFSCSLETGDCLFVMESSPVRTLLWPQRTNSTVTGTGPVAAFIDSSGKFAALRRGTSLVVFDLSSQLVVTSYPVGTGEARSVTLAGSPLMLALVNGQTPPTLSLGVVSQGGFELSQLGLWDPDLALASGAQGLLVATRDEPAQLSTSVVAVPFRVTDAGSDGGVIDGGSGTIDAGLSDAGAADAGARDGGSSDGGATETDGGVDAGMDPLVASGCACSTFSGAEWGAWVLALWALRRRR